MKITESRLRRIIRGVIKENFEEYEHYQINPSRPEEMSNLLDHLGIDPHKEEEKVNIVASIACDILNCSIEDLDLCIEELRLNSEQRYLDFVDDVSNDFRQHRQYNEM